MEHTLARQSAAQPSGAVADDSFTIGSFWGSVQKAWELVDGTLGVNDKLDWLCGAKHATHSRGLDAGREGGDGGEVKYHDLRGSVHGAEDSAQLTLCAAGHSEIFSVTPVYGVGNAYFGSAAERS